MFLVLENGEPAINNSGWSNAEFEKWYDAVEYLRHWIGADIDRLPVHPRLNQEYRIGGKRLKIVRIK